ncbi:MAG: ROK family protein, partial [Candidatus Nanopelagicales bacterium]
MSDAPGLRACIGIDIGGTSIKSGLIDVGGSLIGELHSVPVAGDPLGAVEQAARVAQADRPTCEVLGVGIGSPGYLDAARTHVEYSVNLGWRQLPLVELVQNMLSLAVVLEGDAFVAALGEAIAGGGRGHRDVLAVTLGTGVGVGHVVDGTIVAGAHGMAGQAGHIPMPGIRATCSCGRVGCWELGASTSALDRAARQAGYAGAREVLEDPAAQAIVHPWADAVAAGLVMLAAIIDPDVIVIGGAASASADHFLPRVREQVSVVA